MSADPKKIKEAEGLIKKGHGAMKKSIFHKPDFTEAAGFFTKGGDMYMRMKLFNEAKEAFENAADAWDKEELQTKSGDLYCTAAKAANQAGDINEVLRLMQQAKVRFLEGGQALAAVRQLKEAAQKVKASNPEAACTLYEEMLEVVENENQYHWEKDSFVDYAILRLQMKDYPKCIKAWDRAKKAFLVRNNTDAAAHCVVSEIAIQLQQGDIVAAERIFTEGMQEDYFTSTEDFSMIDMIIRGVKNQDGDLLEIGQRNFILQFLKPEIARIICAFKAPKSVKEEPKQEEPKQTIHAAEAEEAPQAEEPAEEPAAEDDNDWLL